MSESRFLFRKLTNATDLKKLIAIYQAAFEDKRNVPDEKYLDSLIQQTDIHCFGVFIENQLIGGLTTYFLPQLHSDKKMVYLYEIAIHPTFQRNKAGSFLFNAFIQECKLKQKEVIFVQADSEDEYAIEFYRQFKGNEILAFQFDFDL